MDGSGNLDDLNKTPAPVRAGAQVLDVRTTMELSLRSRFDRVAFAVVYAVLALLVLPWQAAVGWIAVIVAWEWLIAPPLDPVLLRLPEDKAAAAYVGLNLIGSILYQAVPFMCLTVGTPIGVAIGVTWITGSVLNTFVYSNASRALLLTTLGPAFAAALVGPWLAYGLHWGSLIVPLVIGLSSLAAQRFSLDHDALLKELADRQFAFTNLERKLSIATEASGDGMFEADIPGELLRVNTNWLTMLGYAPGDIDPTIKDWRGFVHPDDIDALQEDYSVHFQGLTPHTSAEIRMRCKDGGYKWVLSRARLVETTPDGQPLLMVGTTIDISERKAMEFELAAARDAAESANKAKGVFVANMSHEIRTPLNGVIGVAGALARTGLSDVQREMVELIESSGQMLDRMLSDILDQAKIEAGDFQLQTAPFELRREIEAAAELMRARANEKGLRFRLDYASGAEGWFAGDAVRLRQIVSNLASNAVKFTQKGEVVIRVAVDEVAEAANLAWLRIEVSDTGIGFDAEAAERLFGRFVQADGSISRQFGGSGLGLSICKALSTLMGGEIIARSRPGQGSTFTVTVPLPRTAAPQRPARAEAGTPDAAALLPRTRILLAEDHPTNQRVVQLILEPAGADLTIVDDGRQAVEAFRPGLFDLILMDMQMPVMDGLAATQAIRAIERAAGAAPVPIAMFSANAMDEHRAMGVAAGADCHISKPITPERLLAGVEAALALADQGLSQAV